MQNNIQVEIRKEIMLLLAKYGGDYEGAKILSMFLDIIDNYGKR